jgi:alkanesulfonate monooxygenase SsuD/methylene tetrahydromethanopterin reductase-like flavin-dependent oxidoreductase (luciferase family)
VPDEYVEKYAWVGAPAQVASSIAAAVKSGFQNIVLLPQPLADDPGDAIARIAEEVLPRVRHELQTENVPSSQGGHS